MAQTLPIEGNPAIIEVFIKDVIANVTPEIFGTMKATKCGKGVN